jgi:DNA-binding transcriptional ArsR family regulator
MAPRNRSYRHLLQWLIAGTRGGANRGRIIIELKEEPKNANQLGSALEVDYRTVRHHLDVLEKNRLITSMGERYGKLYFISLELEEKWDLFEEIWNKIGKKLKKKDVG